MALGSPGRQGKENSNFKAPLLCVYIEPNTKRAMEVNPENPEWRPEGDWVSTLSNFRQLFRQAGPKSNVLYSFGSYTVESGGYVPPYTICQACTPLYSLTTKRLNFDQTSHEINVHLNMFLLLNLIPNLFLVLQRYSLLAFYFTHFCFVKSSSAITMYLQSSFSLSTMVVSRLDSPVPFVASILHLFMTKITDF